MPTRWKVFFSLAVFSTILLSFIGPLFGQASEPITIGIVQSERFPYATMMKNSFEMALEVINQGGGIQGRPLKLVYADDQGDQRAGVKAVKELAKKNDIVMFVGGYSSSNTVYTTAVADQLDIPFLVTTAADDRITQRKMKNVYRLNPPVNDYAKGLEGMLLGTIQPASVAIVYENSPFGTGAALRMMWFCREHDIEIGKMISYHKERKDPAYFQKIVKPLTQDPPDAIYMVSYLNDGALLVKTIRESGIASLLLGGAGGFTHYKFPAKAGNAADKLVTATLWTQQLPYPGTRQYYDQYGQMYGSAPDYHGVEAYAGLLVAADALKRAVSLKPKDIRAALDETRMETPFGPVHFTSYGRYQRQNSLPTMVLQVIDGKFEFVWPEDVATSSFVPPSGWTTSRKE
jgi:branched-chain amino acid transport system substrate-binding protein